MPYTESARQSANRYPFVRRAPRRPATSPAPRAARPLRADRLDRRPASRGTRDELDAVLGPGARDHEEQIVCVVPRLRRRLRGGDRVSRASPSRLSCLTSDGTRRSPTNRTGCVNWPRCSRITTSGITRMMTTGLRSTRRRAWSRPRAPGSWRRGDEDL